MLVSNCQKETPDKLGLKLKIQGQRTLSICDHSEIKIRFVKGWFDDAHLTSCVDQKLLITQFVSDEDMTPGPDSPIAPTWLALKYMS